MNWKSISLFKFQQMDAINSRSIPDIDKLLYSACTVFDITEHQMNNANPKKALRLIKKIEKLGNAVFKPEAKKRIGVYNINFDIGSMTFGQYIELSFYFSTGPLKQAHNIMASISDRIFKGHDTSRQAHRAEYFLRQPVEVIVGCLNEIMAQFASFNKQYKNLFGLDDETHEGDAKVDFFNKRYGWIYSASQVAEYERIQLNDAYQLNIRQALHDLTYLKEKGRYEALLIKQNTSHARQ